MSPSESKRRDRPAAGFGQGAPGGIALAFKRDPDAAEVRAIFQHAPWARARTTRGIARMLRTSLCLVTARRSGRLVGFGRAWGDGLYRAVIDDLVVLPAERGKKLGTRIVRKLLTRLQGIEEVSLTTALSTASFYERLGFKPYRGAHLKNLQTRQAGRRRLRSQSGTADAQGPQACSLPAVGAA